MKNTNNEKLLMYSGVVYDDQTPDTFLINIKDTGIITEGETVEEAYTEASRQLDAYIECMDIMEETPPTPTSFEAVKKSKSKNIVLIVSSKRKK